jgi:carbon storage regulator
MLVLSRRVGERIDVGDDISVCIVSMKGGVVRVGVEAPEDVKILRSELQRDETNEEEKTTRSIHKRQGSTDT